MVVKCRWVQQHQRSNLVLYKYNGFRPKFGSLNMYSPPPDYPVCTRRSQTMLDTEPVTTVGHYSLPKQGMQLRPKQKQKHELVFRMFS